MTPLYQIEVSVKSQFVEEDSRPDKNRYAFAYDIILKNTGDISARLLTRTWIIRNSEDRSFEVRGEGVLGEKPLLKPGEIYEYTSGVVLDTPFGYMEGSYQFEAEDGHRFSAVIPAFMLIIPTMLH